MKMMTCFYRDPCDVYFRGYRIRIRSVQSNRKRTAPTVGRHEDNPNDYIAAELDKQDEDRPFMIGDGETYGGYFNAPLDKDKQYEMILITISKVGEVSAKILKLMRRLDQMHI